MLEIKLNWLDLAWLRYYYFHIKVFFCSSITLDDHLAINSKKNLSYLRTMFPCGQSYANLCKNPAINWSLQKVHLKICVACHHKHAENLPTKSAQMLTPLLLRTLFSGKTGLAERWLNCFFAIYDLTWTHILALKSPNKEFLKQHFS